MTLGESTQRLIAAIESQDMPAIQAALDVRASAIVEFSSSSPSLESLSIAAACIEAGNAALQSLHTMQQQIVSGSQRVTQIRESFVESQLRAHCPHVDYRG